MNCKDCKHWRRGGALIHEGYNNLPGELVGKTSKGTNVICVTDAASKIGLCLHPAVTSDYVDEWLNRKAPTDRPDGIYACDDEQRASLNVGQDFGCIYFSR